MSTNVVKRRASGVLPKVRPVLKTPTTKQVNLVEKSKQPLPKGLKGQGYAEGIKHPIGSHRDPPKPVFIDIEKFINATVREPKKTFDLSSKTESNSDTNNKLNVLSDKQKVKLEKSNLRRKFFIESVKNYENRLLKIEKLNQQREELINLERKKELNELNKSKLSDLTIPTINDWINKPIMKPRTNEENELLSLKRKYNRDYLKFKNDERKLIKLINMFHIADEFIVTEKQLVEKLDKLIPIQNADINKNNNANNASILNSINYSSATHNNKNQLSLNNRGTIQNNKKDSIENELLDDMLGTVVGKPGLSMVKDYLKTGSEDKLYDQGEKLGGNDKIEQNN